MGCFVVAEFLLTSASCGPSAIAEPLVFSNLDRKCIISEERLVLELPTSRAMLATARPSCCRLGAIATVHKD